MFRSYIKWSENLMAPQPMRPKELSSVVLKRIQISGIYICVWLMSIILLAITLNDADAIKLLLAPILKANSLPVLGVFLFGSIIALTAMLYLCAHRGLWRFSERRDKLDEWEVSQLADINRYGYYIGVFTAGLVLFSLAVKFLFSGMYGLTALNVGIIIAMGVCLQVFGSFTIWSWRQKPLDEDSLTVVGRVEDCEHKSSESSHSDIMVFVFTGIVLLFVGGNLGLRIPRGYRFRT